MPAGSGSAMSCMNSPTGVDAPRALRPSGGMTRRRGLQLTALASVSAALSPRHAWAGRAANPREYHLCLNPQAVLGDPDFLGLVARAGVSCVWLDGFFYGHWPWSIETLTRAREALRQAGLETRIVNVPLGHPGDSLGARDGDFPLTPPTHWRLGSNREGKPCAGTSLACAGHAGKRRSRASVAPRGLLAVLPGRRLPLGSWAGRDRRLLLRRASGAVPAAGRLVR